MFSFFGLSERRLHHLYTIVSRTGFALMPDVDHSDDLRGMSIVTAESLDLRAMDADDWEEHFRAHLPLVIHNAIYSRDFPVNKDLRGRLLNAEKRLCDYMQQASPWCDLLYNAGIENNMPDFEKLSSGLDQATQTALALDRPNFEATMKDIADTLVQWCNSNRQAIQQWHETHASQFC